MLSQLKEKFENIKENFNAGSTIGKVLLYVILGLILLILLFYLFVGISISMPKNR